MASLPFVYRLTITLAFASMVVALSISPGIEQPGDSVFTWLVVNTATPVQKTMHIAVYGALSALWIWTLEFARSRVLQVALSLTASIGMGTLLEWQQIHVPGRYGTISDVLLNVLGAIAGLLLAWFFRRRWIKSSS